MTNEKRKVRKVGIMIGSISDLPQCQEGLEYLLSAEVAGKIEFKGMFVNSIHRNTLAVLKNLYEQTDIYGVDCWIIGAGMANHLTGTCDAYLRYEMQSTVPVFGAIFEAASDKDKNREAAMLSISQVPGTQAVFSREAPNFLDACKMSIEMFDYVAKPAKPKPVECFYSLEEALDRIKAIQVPTQS